MTLERRIRADGTPEALCPCSSLAAWEVVGWLVKDVKLAAGGGAPVVRLPARP